MEMMSQRQPNDQNETVAVIGARNNYIKALRRYA
jgi:hypothetical protein